MAICVPVIAVSTVGENISDVNSPRAGNEILLLNLYYRAFGIMSRCGMHSYIHKLSSSVSVCVQPPLHAEPVTCASFLSSFIKSDFNTSGEVIASEPTSLPPIPPNEALSLFGFSTWTKSLKGISKLDSGLQVALNLFEMGLISDAKQLGTVVYKGFQDEGDRRGQIDALCLLADTEFQAGMPEKVVSWILSTQALMSSIGDASLVCKLSILLMSSYLKLGQAAEANRVAEDSLELLYHFASLALPSTNQVVLSSKKSQNFGSFESENSSANLKKDQSVSEELSHENVFYLAKLLMRYVDVLETAVKSEFASKFREAACVKSSIFGSTGPLNRNASYDPRDAINHIDEKLRHLQEFVIRVHGCPSILSAEVISKRSFVKFGLVSLVHNKYSLLIPEDNYNFCIWVKKMIGEVISEMESVVGMYTGLYARTPSSEFIYTPVADSSQKCPTILKISSSIFQSLVRSQLLLVKYYRFFAVFSGEDMPLVSKTVSITANTEDVSEYKLERANDPVEEFLLATEQPKQFVEDDFSTPHLFKAVQVARAVETSMLDTPSVSEAAACLVATCEFSQMKGANLLSSAWALQISSHVANETLQYATDLELIKASLITRVRQCSSLSQFEIAGEGSLALVEILGQRNAKEAAMWLLQYQGIQARSWMFSVWKAALNPASQIANTLNRMQDLSASTSINTTNQALADVHLLNNLNTAWKRLDVTSDPPSIIARLPDSTFVLCIQADPLLKTLYVAAGSNGNLSTWCVDKILLSEAFKQKLNMLQEEHAIWITECSRFVATFGEFTCDRQDVEGFESSYGDQNLRKTESLLEEQLQKRLSDLSELVGPVLGPDSIIAKFLKSQLTSPVSSPKTSSLILLLDVAFQDLPWEGLSLSSMFDGALSRDFSIHLVGHRIVSTLKFANQTGQQSTLSPITNPTVSSSSVKCIVDPYQEDGGQSQKGFELAPMQKLFERIRYCKHALLL